MSKLFICEESFFSLISVLVCTIKENKREGFFLEGNCLYEKNHKENNNRIKFGYFDCFIDD